MAEGTPGPGAEGVSSAPPPSGEGSSVTQRLETQVLPAARAEATARDSAAKDAAAKGTPQAETAGGEPITKGETPPTERRVPDETAKDPRYQEIRNNLIKMAETNSPDGKIDIAKIDKLALDQWTEETKTGESQTETSQAQETAKEVDPRIKDMMDKLSELPAEDRARVMEILRDNLMKALAKEKDPKKRLSLLELLALVVSTVIQETVGMAIPRGR